MKPDLLEQLFSASSNGKLNNVKFLIEYKQLFGNLQPIGDITTDPISYYIFRAICLACKHGHVNILEYLHTKYPAIPLHQADHYPLQLACCNGHNVIVTTLLTYIKTGQHENLELVYWYLRKFDFPINSDQTIAA